MGNANQTPAYPKYQTVEARLATFSGWPKDKTPTAVAMAAAGFFDEGIRTDKMMTCFQCSCGSIFDPLDDPWVQHARLFFWCPYIKNTNREQAKAAAIAAAIAVERDAIERREKLHPWRKPEAGNSAGRHSNLCKVCQENSADIVFVPCEHKVTCVRCAAYLALCPVCQKDIKSSVRI